MIRDSLEKRMPDLLSNTLKNILPQLLNDSVKKLMPKFNKRVKKTLKAEVPNVVLKPLNKEFNALNKLKMCQAPDAVDQLHRENASFNYPVASHVNAATKGEKESHAQPDPTMDAHNLI
ncbi:hypothetical protein Tco_0847503 [Tanacetum coccineum]